MNVAKINSLCAFLCRVANKHPSVLVCRDVTLLNQRELSFQAVTAGDGWVAAATSLRNVRLFTVGGVQCLTFTLPGPVVCLTAHRQRLMAVYHAGMGKLTLTFMAESG